MKNQTLARSLRAVGAADARAGKSIDAFYAVSMQIRHTEGMRASYEIGYRAEKEAMRKEQPESTPYAVVITALRGGAQHLATTNRFDRLRSETLCGLPWVLKTGQPFAPKDDCPRCRKIQEERA